MFSIELTSALGYIVKIMSHFGLYLNSYFAVELAP